MEHSERGLKVLNSCFCKEMNNVWNSLLYPFRITGEAVHKGVPATLIARRYSGSLSCCLLPVITRSRAQLIVEKILRVMESQWDVTNAFSALVTSPCTLEVIFIPSEWNKLKAASFPLHKIRTNWCGPFLNHIISFDWASSYKFVFIIIGVIFKIAFT